jgi:4-hydroxyphenylpyruvate dioxygenase
MSKVMSNGNGRIKFPINEPAEGKKNHKLRNIWLYGGPEFSISLLQQMILSKRYRNWKQEESNFYLLHHTYYEAIPERLGAHMGMMKEDNEIEN